jgi:hypothetical protein
MDSSTLNTTNFIVSAGGVQLGGTISYNPGSQTVYFSPGIPLSAFTYISVSLTTGVKDTEGTSLAQDFTWSFTTGGSYAPSKIIATNAGGDSILTFNNAGVANGNIFRTEPSSAVSLSKLGQQGSGLIRLRKDSMYQHALTIIFSYSTMLLWPLGILLPPATSRAPQQQ